MRSSLPHIGTIATLCAGLAALGTLTAAVPAADSAAVRLAVAVRDVDAAAHAGALWLHTRERLAAARRAFAAGDTALAARLAAAADAEARLALEQHALESARYRLRRARELGVTPPAALEAAIARRDGRAAAAAAARLGPLP
ncbi:MAG: hypothetical protein HY749_01235 [Gammaproteobacteria bacterium]|nr:hypothetical protein [Gammaproteobacteria bacterium]MBI5618487.1 hypothetical protein [Gammaproteobacteria bacterium]